MRRPAINPRRIGNISTSLLCQRRTKDLVQLLTELNQKQPPKKRKIFIPPEKSYKEMK